MIGSEISVTTSPHFEEGMDSRSTQRVIVEAGVEEGKEGKTQTCPLNENGRDLLPGPP